MIVQDLLDPCFAYFRSYSQNWCTSAKPLFLASEVCRKSREHARNLKIRFYRLVGRVRTLRVPARRLGALIRRVSLDKRKVPLGDHFGIKH